MESVGSNSPPRTRSRSRSDGSRSRSDGSRSDSSNQAVSAQQVADRIIRALEHQLRLLHRDGPHFYILGSTGNVYTITLADTLTCTCPDRSNPCKHILFVLLRVLNLTFDEACVWRRSIRPCELARFLAIPTTPNVLAGPRARALFLRLLSGANQQGRGIEGVTVLRQEGAVCPVCLDEMSNGQGVRLVTCGTCGNSVHGECFDRWKRSRGRRGVSCVVCRARWRERREGERYVNLSVYVSGDDEAVHETVDGLCVG